MPVKIVDKTPLVLNDTQRKASLALRFMLDGIDKISTPNTPKDTSDLRNRKIKQVLGLKARITWGTEYAVYQESNQYSNYTTAGTGPHFAENAVDDVVKDAKSYFRRAGING